MPRQNIVTCLDLNQCNCGNFCFKVKWRVLLKQTNSLRWTNTDLFYKTYIKLLFTLRFAIYLSQRNLTYVAVWKESIHDKKSVSCYSTLSKLRKRKSKTKENKNSDEKIQLHYHSFAVREKRSSNMDRN